MLSYGRAKPNALGVNPTPGKEPAYVSIPIVGPLPWKLCLKLTKATTRKDLELLFQRGSCTI